MTKTRTVVPVLVGTVACASGLLTGCAKPTYGPEGFKPAAIGDITTWEVTLTEATSEYTASDDEVVRFQCDWTETTADGDVERRFDVFLWAPPGEEAKVTIPSSGMDGLDLNSGYLLMQGVNGSRPRSKSGGSHATGNGTTIVLWAGSDSDGDALFRAVCVGGAITVSELRAESSFGTLYNLDPQTASDGFYFEWDVDRVTDTSGSYGSDALLRKVSSESNLEDDIEKLLERTRTTPD